MSDLGNGAGTIGGGWLGTYAYKGRLQRQPAVRFEATFSEPDTEGQFSGTVLDDGGLGDANLAGKQSGPGIRFTKEYKTPRREPVSYEGTLAGDGRTMTGTWRLSHDDHGVWDARRAWTDPGPAAEDEQAWEDTPEREMPRVREVVRLG